MSRVNRLLRMKGNVLFSRVGSDFAQRSRRRIAAPPAAPD
jgi:hypothetical protein